MGREQFEQRCPVMLGTDRSSLSGLQSRFHKKECADGWRTWLHVGAGSVLFMV
jgi:hypothetical protein